MLENKTRILLGFSSSFINTDKSFFDAPIVTNIDGVWSMHVNGTMDDKQLHLGGGHDQDQVNVTGGMVVPVELTLWITDTLSAEFIR